MKRLSLICVYNNRQLCDSMVNSCVNQTVGFDNIEFILIDNTTSVFASAAAALNFGVRKSTTDILVFLHQDIEFLQDDALAYIVEYITNNPKSLVGAAGVKSRQFDHDGRIISSMYAGPYKVKYSEEKHPQKAFVLDECLFACRKNLFEKIDFDEQTCNSWHLYAADLCLQALLNNYVVEVIPLSQVWHKSNGNADKSYFCTQNALAKKYRRDYKIINTTNSYVYTNSLKRIAQNIYRRMKYHL